MTYLLVVNSQRGICVCVMLTLLHDIQDIHCTYRFLMEESDTQTDMVPSSPDPVFNHVRIWKRGPITSEVNRSKTLF